jgi:hypothetical protein
METLAELERDAELHRAALRLGCRETCGIEGEHDPRAHEVPDGDLSEWRLYHELGLADLERLIAQTKLEMGHLADGP